MELGLSMVLATHIDFIPAATFQPTVKSSTIFTILLTMLFVGMPSLSQLIYKYLNGIHLWKWVMRLRTVWDYMLQR
jgi:hypothetical protein